MRSKLYTWLQQQSWWRVVLILNIPVLVILALMPILGLDRWERVIQLVFVDLMLSLDNLLVILLVVARVAEKHRRFVLIVGLTLALLLRAALATVGQELIHYTWLAVLGGVLLLRIANELWPEDKEEGARQRNPLNQLTAIVLCALADFTASLDNSVSNAGIARSEVWLGLLGLALSMLVLCCLLLVSTMTRRSGNAIVRWLATWRRERIRLQVRLSRARQRQLRHERHLRMAGTRRRRHPRSAAVNLRVAGSRGRLQRSPAANPRVAGSSGKKSRLPMERARRRVEASKRLRQLHRRMKVTMFLQQILEPVLRLGVYVLAVGLLAWTGSGLILLRASLPLAVEIMLRLAIVAGTVAWHWLGPWLGECIPQRWRRRFGRLKELRKEKIGQPLERRTESLLAHWPWGQRLWRELRQLSS